jgi:hypothetical protein
MVVFYVSGRSGLEKKKKKSISGLDKIIMGLDKQVRSY